MGSLVGYAYVLKLDNAAAFSSQSYGLRFTGRRKLQFNNDLSFLYAAEYAHQRPHANNAGDFDLNYYLAEPGIQFRDLTVKLGYEVLEGDGTAAFQRQLATLHAFNGIIDKLLVTPANGIEDIYTKIKYKIGDVGPLKGVALIGAYHVLRSEQTSADIGEEWNAKLAMKLTKNISFSVQHADYKADTVSTDTTKTWITLQLSF